MHSQGSQTLANTDSIFFRTQKPKLEGFPKLKYRIFCEKWPMGRVQFTDEIS